MRKKTSVTGRIKLILAILLVFSVATASLQCLAQAEMLYDTDSDDRLSDEESESPDNETLEEKVEKLCADGEYVEGQVLVLYDRFHGSFEELTGSSDVVGTGNESSEEEHGLEEGDGSANLSGTTSLVDNAVLIDGISAESYVEATGEVLAPAFEEELVGSSGSETPDDVNSESEDRISVLLIEDENRSTRELLSEVLREKGVLYAQPNYIHEPYSTEPPVSAEEGAEEDVSGQDNSVVSQKTVVERAEEDISGQDNSPKSLEPSKESEEKDLIGQGSDITSLLAGTSPEDGSFDLTKYQWEYAGDSYTPVTEYDPADLYNVHSPNWNETGSQNAAGVVAVIDCGVDYEHPDLKDVMYVFPPELQEKLQCGPYGINTAETGDKKNPMDYESHGTHCAGVIAGAWDGKGISGLASGCRIMAIKVIEEDNTMTDLAIVKAMAFVCDAADSGVDVRVTSNSYSGEITCPLMVSEIEELEKRGIVCVYSSGNESTCFDLSDNSNLPFSKSSNTVIVNAATPTYEKAHFSNYGAGDTDVYAPGVSILSSVSTQKKADSSKTYFGSFDPNAAYYNTEFDSVPKVISGDLSAVKLSASQSADGYSYDHDGKALKVSLDEVREGLSAFSFSIDIPVGDNEQVLYTSLAIYIPGGQHVCSIDRQGTEKDGKRIAAKSLDNDVCGNWSIVSISNVPELLQKGTEIPLHRTEDGSQNFIRLNVNVYKPEGSFMAGETIFIDQIGAGSNTAALLPYTFKDGTSMACPHVAAEAAILYCGRDRNKASAAEVVSEIKSRVLEKEHLESCSSHGAIDMGVSPGDYGPVITAVVTGDTDKTILITGKNFGEGGNVIISGTEAESVSWSDERVIVRCPSGMRSGIQIVQVKTDAGFGSGSFLFTVPDSSSDHAVPLYETDIPDIPKELNPKECAVAAVLGLNDYIYVLLHDQLDYDDNYAKSVLRYSPEEKIWEKVADLPEAMAYISVAGYRGKLLVSGTYRKGEKLYTTVFSYSPRTGLWKNLDWGVYQKSSLVNMNGDLYTIGGVKYNKDTDSDEFCKIINYMDIAGDDDKFVGELETAVLSPHTATDGKAIYVSGGFTLQNGKSEESRELVQRIEIGAGRTGKTSECYPHTDLPTGNYPAHEVITGYRNIYLVGYSGVEAEDGEGYIDAAGDRVLDADTYILSDEEYIPYGKRASYDNLVMVCSAEYKGVLYVFGNSVREGDNYLNPVSRSTKVGEAVAPWWDTFAIKIPSARKGLVYNGKEQTGVHQSPKGYYTITGNVGTEAGTYTATLKLKDPDWCTWEDGTIEDKTVTWSIGPSPTAFPTGVTGKPRPSATVKPQATASAKPRVTVTPRNSASQGVSSKSTSEVSKKDGTGATTVPAAKTGDESRPVLWILVSVMAGFIIRTGLKRRWE